ncbi:glycosyltransferase [Cellulomonas algicola]|uniref:glycosyltransferase n=1 Tax=Cellulomonas algicola TaxID=2071633 RepID=UPI000F569B2F|nr:glycosyltransferase [Cellulomonas algicola]
MSARRADGRGGRVLFVCRSTSGHPGSGGMERVLDELLRAAREAGHDVALLTTPGGGTSEAAVVWTAGRTGGRYSWRWWWESSRSGPWTRWQPDAVVSVGDAGGALVLRRRRPPVAVQVHGTTGTELASSLRARTRRELLKVPLHVLRFPSRRLFVRRADAVWPVSDALRDALLRAPYRLDPRRVTTLHNGVDPRALDAAPDDVAAVAEQVGARDGGRTGLYVGRLHEQKGVDLAIGALGVLPSDHRLVVAGDGPDADRLRALARARGLDGRVTFVGAVPRGTVAALLRVADVLLVPSLRTEGAPVVLLEAAAVGVPVVATRHAQVPAELAAGATVVAASVDALAAGWRAATTRGRAPYLPAALTRDHVGAAYARALDGLVHAGGAR